MTVIVEPSKSRGEANHENLSATSRWGAVDWIVPSDVDKNASRHGLSNTPLNAFAATTSTSSLDVSFDTGEAFIHGTWLASDDTTHTDHPSDVTLPSNSTTTVYLGYDLSASDTILIGKSGDFASNDPKIPIYDFTTDGSGVTDTFHRRPIGLYSEKGELIASTYDNDSGSSLTLDTGTLSETYEEYRIVVYKESHSSSRDNHSLRLNGSSAGNYYYDYYDNIDHIYVSNEGQSEFDRIAETKADGSSDESGIAFQEIRVTCPRQIVSNSKHYPLIDTVHKGVGEDAEFIEKGHFKSDTDKVDQLNVFSGGNATGFIEIYGRGMRHGA